MTRRKPVPNSADFVHLNQGYREDPYNEEQHPFINEELFVGSRGFSTFLLTSGSGPVFIPLMNRLVKITTHH